jgi:hypothetical protein
MLNNCINAFWNSFYRNEPQHVTHNLFKAIKWAFLQGYNQHNK